MAALEQVVDGAQGGVDAPAAQPVQQRVEVEHGISAHSEGRKDPCHGPDPGHLGDRRFVETHIEPIRPAEKHMRAQHQVGSPAGKGQVGQLRGQVALAVVTTGGEEGATAGRALGEVGLEVGERRSGVLLGMGLDVTTGAVQVGQRARSKLGGPSQVDGVAGVDIPAYPRRDRGERSCPGGAVQQPPGQFGVGEDVRSRPRSAAPAEAVSSTPSSRDGSATVPPLPHLAATASAIRSRWMVRSTSRSSPSTAHAGGFTAPTGPQALATRSTTPATTRVDVAPHRRIRAPRFDIHPTLVRPVRVPNRFPGTGVHSAVAAATSRGDQGVAGSDGQALATRDPRPCIRFGSSAAGGAR